MASTSILKIAIEMGLDDFLSNVKSALSEREVAEILRDSVLHGDTEVIGKVLSFFGADVNHWYLDSDIEDDVASYITPLAIAASNCDIATIEFLLDNGADPKCVECDNIYHSKETTPRDISLIEYYVANKDYSDEEEMRELLETLDGYVDSKFWFENSVRNLNSKALYWLSDIRQTPLIIDDQGNNLFHALSRPAITGSEDDLYSMQAIYQDLVNMGFDPTTPNNFGESPVDAALKYKDGPALFLYTEAGIMPNYDKIRINQTELQQLILARRGPEVIKELILRSLDSGPSESLVDFCVETYYVADYLHVALECGAPISDYAVNNIAWRPAAKYIENRKDRDSIILRAVKFGWRNIKNFDTPSRAALTIARALASESRELARFDEWAKSVGAKREQREPESPEL